MNKRVCAVVVTYNRHALLRRCLGALQEQMSEDDCILVVNNASTDHTLAMLSAEFSDVEILDLPENIGGAGGFHAGMKWAFDAGYAWAWLMDDDGYPLSGCLDLLMEQAGSAGVLVPSQQDGQGGLYGVAIWRGERRDLTTQIAAAKKPVAGKFLFAFVGPLISRDVIAEVGLPNRDFFIWFDDYEYALRIHRTSKARLIAVPEARFFHDIYGELREVSVLGRRSQRASQAAWKTYYGTRNQLFTMRSTRRSRRDLWRFYRSQLQHLLGDIVYEPDGRRRAALRLMGLRDGFAGRLGKRVQPG